MCGNVVYDFKQLKHRVHCFVLFWGAELAIDYWKRLSWLKSEDICKALTGGQINKAHRGLTGSWNNDVVPYNELSRHWVWFPMSRYHLISWCRFSEAGCTQGTVEHEFALTLTLWLTLYIDVVALNFIRQGISQAEVAWHAHEHPNWKVILTKNFDIYIHAIANWANTLQVSYIIYNYYFCYFCVSAVL